MKKLLCHTELINSLGVLLKEGKVYGVFDEDDYCYYITDETGEEHGFTKVAGEDGKSYKTWLTLIEEEN